MAATVAPAAEATQPPLDDLMLAMDVVDTLRHNEAIAEREVAGVDRRARLIARLKEIYAAQGIAVPDRILADGVDALEQDRFVYKAKTGGFSFTLARLYVRRAEIGRRVGIVAAIVLALFAGWYFFVQRPAAQRTETARIELSQTIPERLAALQRDIGAEARDPAVTAAAAITARDGLAAANAGNAEPARAAITSLESTLAELRTVFEVRIVSRPGLPSAFTRIYNNNPTENFYLLVEAIDPSGRALTRQITSEEDQATRSLALWGVRVPEATFNAVADDKLADGIVQNALVGTKDRGNLDVTWTMPVSGGFVTEGWDE